MNDDEILELGNNLKEGIPFATPVFDGAKEKDITNLLSKSGVSNTGQEIYMMVLQVKNLKDQLQLDICIC